MPVSDASETTRAAGQSRDTGAVKRLRVSATASIANALVIKDGGVFFLCKPDAQVPVGGEHGFGLYYHDCRFLNGYELRIRNTELDLLASTSVGGFTASIELTNTDIDSDEQTVEKEQVGIRWNRTVDGRDLLLQDEIAFANYAVERVGFPVSLEFGSSFESVFTVRGMAAEKRGTLYQASWQEGALRFLYEGADGVYRSLTVSCSPAPRSTQGTCADFDLGIEPGQTSVLRVTLQIHESRRLEDVKRGGGASRNRQQTHDSQKAASDESLARCTAIETDSRILASAFERSLRDLRVLENHDQDKAYYSAGIPWYVALFGRDSLISACQTLAFNQQVAGQTLQLLARYQGKRNDGWRDENPGKIMHELRVGEMAHLNEIPQTPYYGTVDATPLFLVLVARHAQWTGSLDLFEQLRPNIDAALQWMSEYGDANHDGFLEYSAGSSKGLSNQGWKDSGESIMNADGSLARPPISLVEVQGYMYLAKTGIAALHRQSGDDKAAAQLEKEAADLRARFNKSFWLDDQQFYALALQKDDRPCAVIASNPGQALWTGIADEDKAQKTVRRLLAGDMFSGWGIRTLSSENKRYNPIGYHLGTVWPHDNSIVAAGFRRYGFAHEVCQVFAAIVEAAAHFPHFRLPEVFAGFARPEFPNPVHYPVACHPQAWAAGSVPFLIEALLGLSPDAFNRRLHIVDPVLPGFVHYLELHRLRVGNAQVDLRFERGGDGRARVEVLKRTGELEVVVGDKPPATSRYS